MTDLNKCDCGWVETSTSDEFNPHRQKCPNCGAPFFEREEIRWFLRTARSTTGRDHIDHDENCSACGVYDRLEDSRFCEGCHDALVTDGGSTKIHEYQCTECDWPIRLGQPETPEWCPFCGVRL